MALYDIADMTTRVRDLLRDDFVGYYSAAEIKRYLLEAQRDMATKMGSIKLAIPFTIAAARTTAHRADRVDTVEYNSLALYKYLPMSMGRIVPSGSTPQYWSESGSTSSGRSLLFDPKPAATYSATMYVDNPAPDYWIGFISGTNIPAFGDVLTEASSAYTGTVTGFMTTSGVWSTTAPTAAGTLFYTPTSITQLFSTGKVLSRTATPICTTSGASSDEFIIPMSYRFLAVLYATAMCLVRDEKYDKSSQLLGIYEMEVNFHRADKYDIPPSSREISIINDHPTRG